MFKSTKKTALGHPNQQIKKYNYLIICDLYKNRDDNCRSQEKAYFTHISHQLGKHEEVSKELPPYIQLAYDGLKIEI
jgi:hypothetical protein